MNSILVNFHIPPPLKFKVDTINKYRNVSRTSVINQLLETYVLDQARDIKSSGELNETIKEVYKHLPVKPKRQPKRPPWRPPMLPPSRPPRRPHGYHQCDPQGNHQCDPQGNHQ